MHQDLKEASLKTIARRLNMEININNETTYTIDVGYKNTIESLSLDIKNQSYFLCIDSRVFLFFEEYLKPLINLNKMDVTL